MRQDEQFVSEQAVKLAEESGRERFVFVDALRGIAAVMVLLHHLLYKSVLEVTLRQILPAAFCSICGFGTRGVEIFFVISGFVIAHSMTKVAPTARGVGNFILRRQLRLDPPYWAIIALTLLDTTIENTVPSLVYKPLPSIGELLSNLVYLQNILHTPQIVDVAWTLCLEIQFYLCFIVLHLMNRFGSNRRSSISLATVGSVFVLGIASLFSGKYQTLYAPFFISFWSYFASGVLCYWSYRGFISKWVFLAFLAAFGVATVWLWSSLMTVGFITAAALFIVGEKKRLSSWLSQGVFQYFGRISYSLYLAHFLVLSVIMRGGYKLTSTNRWAALCWFVIAAAAAVLAAVSLVPQPC